MANKKNVDNFQKLIKLRIDEIGRINQSKSSLHRLVGQSFKALKGVFPVSAINNVDQLLAYASYYQARMEKWYLFEEEVLKGHDLYSLDTSVEMYTYYWTQIELITHSLIEKGECIDISYKSVKNLIKISFNGCPLEIYSRKSLVLNSENQGKIIQIGKKTKYDEWMVGIFNTYLVEKNTKKHKKLANKIFF